MLVVGFGTVSEPRCEVDIVFDAEVAEEPEVRELLVLAVVEENC